jgi:shikimate kinase
MSFENDFKAWLAEGLERPIPTSVKAFSFNLFEYPETPECKFGIEIVGTSSFDANDSDWACDEIWEPSVRTIEIPRTYSGSHWEECLGKTKALITTCLSTMPEGYILKSRLGIGIGFVDGELDVIWQL